ncbi:MAG: HEPN domain-containing protein [Cyclobacteriaceae bacterium]|nr:HEPN domain-containing protein [Cyclobacteriaceae bacterium]
MKYRFLTVLHNLSLEGTEQRSIKLNSNGVISQEKAILTKTFQNKLAIDTLGVHSIDEFENSVFYYLDGEFQSDITEDIINKRGTKFTFALLRFIQQFVFNIWKIKDNNVYVHSGFIFVYENEISDGFTFKAVLREQMSYSNSSSGNTFCTEEELKQTNELVYSVNFNQLFNDEINYKKANHDHFFKYSKSNRTDRAWYFVLSARTSGALPIKIIAYCTALECLFTSSQTELSHRISERVAMLIGVDSIEMVKTYKLIKKAYNIRSTIVHGSILKGTNDDLKEISSELDEILRKLLTGEYEIFTKKDEKIDEYFLQKLFEFKGVF